MIIFREKYLKNIIPLFGFTEAGIQVKLWIMSRDQNISSMVTKLQKIIEVQKIRFEVLDFRKYFIPLEVLYFGVELHFMNMLEL